MWNKLKPQWLCQHQWKVMESMKTINPIIIFPFSIWLFCHWLMGPMELWMEILVPHLQWKLSMNGIDGNIKVFILQMKAIPFVFWWISDRPSCGDKKQRFVHIQQNVPWLQRSIVSMSIYFAHVFVHVFPCFSVRKHWPTDSSDSVWGLTAALLPDRISWLATGHQLRRGLQHRGQP